MTAAKSSISLPPPYRTLEAVRGVAALWVVAFHATKLMTAFDPAIAANPLIQPFYRGNLGVQVFFVVSGYCIANAACSGLAKPAPLWSYARARVRRIFPPCWASLVFFILAAITASWLQHRGQMADTSLTRLDLAHQPISFYLANLTLTQILFGQSFISVVCWTLCYEIAFYLLVGLALAGVLAYPLQNNANPKRIRAMLTILHLLTFICCLFLLFAPRLLPYPFDLWVQFGLGIAVFDLISSPRSHIARVAVITIIGMLTLFLFTQNLLIGYTQEESRWTYATALLSAVVLLAFYSFDQRAIRLLPVRLAAFVGHFSYSLYLINFLAVSALMVLIRKLALSPTAHIAAIYLLVLLVLIPAYVFFYLFERPFLRARRPALAPGPRKDSPSAVPAPDALPSLPTPVTASQA